MQDSNAGSMSPSVSIQRLKSKNSASYKNESWDIIDAYKKDQKKILELEEKQLPEELKGKDAAERKVFIEEKMQERSAAQKKIKDLTNKRDAYIAKQRKEMAATKTLDTVMVEGVRKQASENGFKYK